MIMVLCRYFQEGRCRFGNNCRFEHSSGNNNYQTPNRAPNKDTSQNKYKWTSDDHTPADHTSANNVINELPAELCNKQWLFSCVALEKGLPSIPDISDISQEELRLQAYEAKKDGNFQNYINQVKQVTAEYENTVQKLRNLSSEMKKYLIQLLEDQRKSKSNDSSKSVIAAPSFGSPAATPGLFASNSSGSSSTFGSTAPSTSIFGGGTGHPGSFGNILVQTASNSTQSSIFGGSGQTGAFRSESGQTSIFGNVPGQSGSGSGQTSILGNVLGQTGNVSGQTSILGNFPGQTGSVSGQTSIFGNVAGQSGNVSGQTSIFGNVPGQSGNVSGHTSIFGNVPGQSGSGSGQTSIFGNVPGQSGSGSGQTSILGNFPGQTASAGFNKTGSIFGGNSQASNGQMVGPTTSGSLTQAANCTARCGIYTPLEELTDEEKAAFMAPAFSLGSVPMKAPPREYV